MLVNMKEAIVGLEKKAQINLSEKQQQLYEWPNQQSGTVIQQ